MRSSLSRRVLQVTAALVVLGVLLVGALHLSPVRLRVLAWARGRVLQDLGIVLDADRLSYNLLAPSVELGNVRVSAQGEPPLLQADRVSLSLGRRAWLGTVEIERLELVHPRIVLVRHRDGRTNLPEIPAAPSSAPTPVHLGLVEVLGLQLDFQDEANGSRASAGPLTLTLDTRADSTAVGRFERSPFTASMRTSDEPAAEQRITGTLAGALQFDGQRLTVPQFTVEAPEARLDIRGWIDLIAETARVDATARLESNLAQARRFAAPAMASLNGRVSADIAIVGPASDPRVHVVARGADLALQPISGATATLEANYSSDRLEIPGAQLAADFGTVEAKGAVSFTSDNATRSPNQLTARLMNLDLDRVLALSGVAMPIPIGAMAAGSFDIVLDGKDPFGATWWQHLDGTGSIDLTPKTSGLAPQGRLDLGLHDQRWTLTHQLRSTSAQTTLSGTVAGQLSLDANGGFDSTVSGETVTRVDDLQSALSLIRTAGVEVPPQLADAGGSIDAVLAPRGTLKSPRLVVDLTSRDLHVPAFPDGQIESSLTIDRRAASVSSLRARVGAATLNGSGQYTWSGRIESRYDLTVDDLNAIADLAVAGGLPIAGAARVVGTLEGPVQALQAQAEVTAQSVSAYGVSVGPLKALLRLRDQRVFVEAETPDLRTTLQGSLGLQDPYLFEMETTLERAPIAALLPSSVQVQAATDGTVSATLRASGIMTRLLDSTVVANLRQLDAIVAGTAVVLDAPAVVSIEPGGVSATPVTVRAGKQTIATLEGALGTTDVRDGLRLRVSGPLSDVLAAMRPGIPDVPIEADRSQATLDLRVMGTLQAPDPVGTLTVNAASLRYAEQPALTDVAVAARVEAGQIRLESLTANWLGAQLSGDAVVPLRMVVPEPPAAAAGTGIAAWGSRWLASLPGEPRTASLSARLTNITPGVAAAFVDPAQLESIDGYARATLTAEADAFTLDRIRGLLVLDEGRLTLAGVPLEQSVPSRLRIENGRAAVEEFRWHAANNELRVSGGVDLVAPARPLNLAIDGEVDLRILGAFATGVVAGGIGRPALTVTGTVSAPEVVGRITISGGEVLIDQPRLAADDFEGTIAVGADHVATVSLNGNVNGGAATVTGSVALPDLTRPEGRLTLTARNIGLEYPEGFQTESNADLVLALEPTGATLTGRVDVLSGLYREPIVISRSLLGALERTGPGPADESSFLSTLRLDITVATAEELRIDNNYGRLGVTANLQITGTADRPGAVGRIEAAPDGEVYLAGNTLRVQSLVIDLANPRTIAPEVSFRAETRVGNASIEIALQCTTCEPEVSSPGMSNEEAMARLFGVSGDQADAGAQLGRLLSGELFGIVSRSIGVDTLRLEQGTGRADLFDDPSLIAGDVNPAARLTVGKRIGDHVELAYSQNLADNGFTMTTSYLGPAGISARALLLDDQSRSYEFRHEPLIGAARPKKTTPSEPATIADVRFSGNTGAVSESELRDRLHLREGDRFSFAAWQADRDRLIALYQSRGFFEAHVRARRGPATVVPGAVPKTSPESVALEYDIEANQRTELEVKGFDLPEHVRQRIVSRWSSAIFDGFLERDATLIVRDHLYSRGYLQARVSAAIRRDSSAGLKTLGLTIEPGPVTTPRLEFQGNAVIETARLEALAAQAGPLSAWIDPATFAALVQRLYQSEGLLSAEARVLAPVVEQGQSVVRVVIEEGQPWSVGRVTITGAGEFVPRDAMETAPLVSGARYDPKATAERFTAIEQQFRDAGFLDVRITVSTTRDPGAHTVNIDLLIERGARTLLDAVVVEGAQGNTPEVARSAGLEAGMPVSASSLNATRHKLYETGTYRSVDITLDPVASEAAPTSSGDRHVLARIHVEERARYSFRYGLAFNDDVVGPDQREQRVGLAADFQNRNLLGSGATLGLSARLRSDEEVARAFLSAPRFFGAPLTSYLFLSRGRQEIAASDSSRTVSDVTDVSAEQRYRVRQRLDLRYGYELGHNRTTIESTIPGSDFDLTVRIARLQTSALIERRNDPFDPSRGSFTSASAELSHPDLGSELSFLRSFVQRYQFFPVPHGMVVASAIRVGLARTFRDETLIPSERFFGGGATSVRGYSEQALGGRALIGGAEGGQALLIVNSELRFPIHRWLRGVSFVDLGNVYPTVSDLFSSGVQVGAGGGIRVNSPVGLLRLDVGFPLNPRDTDQSWRIHFGLGHAF